MSETPARLDALAAWLQRDDDEVLYAPDGQHEYDVVLYALDGLTQPGPVSSPAMARLCYYVLDGQTPVPCTDPLAWGEWFLEAERHVALTQVAEGIEVSTVFLGLDHGFGRSEAPLLFETMTFGLAGEPGEVYWRYATWAEAEAGHRAMCAVIRAALRSGAVVRAEEE